MAGCVGDTRDSVARHIPTVSVIQAHYSHFETLETFALKRADRIFTLGEFGTFRFREQTFVQIETVSPVAYVSSDTFALKRTVGVDAESKGRVTVVCL